MAIVKKNKITDMKQVEKLIKQGKNCLGCKYSKRGQYLTIGHNLYCTQNQNMTIGVSFVCVDFKEQE